MKLNKLLSQGPKKESKVVPTSIASLDSTIGGLHVGQVCTVAARPSMGKTAFAMTLAKNIGIMNKVPTAILSLEHAEDYVVERLFATQFGWPKDNTSATVIVESKMNVDMEKAVAMLQNAGFRSTEMEKEEFIQKMKEAPVWIEHGVNLTVDEVITRVERMKKRDNIQVLIIDGLAWIIAGQTYTEREQSMLKLNQLASRLNIAILITSELTRDVEHRVGNKPMLSDLRGGFCAEVYSAIVMFIYRPEYYGIEIDEYGNTKDVADIIIAKNDFGAVGEVRLKFAEHSRFEDFSISQIESECKEVEDSLF